MPNTTPQGTPQGTPPSPEWLDAQYNNRALVPDFARHLQHWASESAQVRQRGLDSGQVVLDVPFGWPPADGLGAPTLDVFRPQPMAALGAPTAPAALGATTAPGAPVVASEASGGGETSGPRGPRGPSETSEAGGAPVLLFIHGGYWRALDKADHSFVAAPFAAQGACVLVPNYSLVGAAQPTARVSHITQQMRHAVAWAWQHAAEFGGNPERITVVGHSAGGQLVGMLLATDWEALGAELGLALPAQLVRQGVSISGLFDMEPIRRTPFLADLQLSPEEAAAQSPARLPAPLPPCTLATVVGADESNEFKRQNRLIQAAWGAAAVPVCEELPGLHHFSVLDALAQPTSRLHALVTDALHR